MDSIQLQRTFSRVATSLASRLRSWREWKGTFNWGEGAYLNLSFNLLVPTSYLAFGCAEDRLNIQPLLKDIYDYCLFIWYNCSTLLAPK